MEWYLKVVRDNYANFNGRASRQEYWMFILFNFIFTIVVGFIDGFLSLGFLSLLYLLAILIPGLAVLVRRLHDVNKSGWWFFIIFIPIIGAIWMLILLCTDGNPGENSYGPSPKAAPVSNKEPDTETDEPDTETDEPDTETDEPDTETDETS